VCWDLWHALLLQLIRRAHYTDVIFSLLSMTPAGENEKGFLYFFGVGSGVGCVVVPFILEWVVGRSAGRSVCGQKEKESGYRSAATKKLR